jgi:hypothetical protein
MAPEQVGDVVESAIGWLLDVTVERNAATLWIKLKEGGNLRIVDINQVSTSCQEMSRQVANPSISYLHNPGRELSDKGNLPILTLADLKLCFASIYIKL